MTIYRTDVEKALDEIISNEGGMRFQGLAVTLAKQKWPELIACERHHDLGLDAYSSSSCSKDNLGRGVICSVTATLDKIIGDIKRFQKHYSDVKILFFATPCRVTKYTSNSWKEKIQQEFGIELQVISREDIIMDLMIPANTSLSRSHLNIQVIVEPTIQEMLVKANEATTEVINAWLSHPRLVQKPKLALKSVKLDDDGRETHETLNHEDLLFALRGSRRIVLEAPSGQGKTTTLSQLGDLLCKRNEITFLVDLPAWIASDNNDILDYLAKSPAFRSRSISVEALAQIYESVNCSFLLNGWNEISSDNSNKAARMLANLERNFPKAGILVATRNHHIQPPLPGSFRVKLLSLNRKQRKEYLDLAVKDRAGELISQLNSDRVLDALTRTPLILAEVATIFLSGSPIPKTKSGVIKAVIRLVESADEHRDHLARMPLQGKSSAYLTQLAICMTERGTVVLDDATARKAISAVSDQLIADGQIAAKPEPLEVLSALCAHHIVERLQYPEEAFKFQHQQFQEWYVSTIIEKRLLVLIDQASNQEFARLYINEPSWESSIRMIAENIGESNQESPEAKALLKAGKLLIELVLDVDPIFAAELARLCGNTIWLEVREIIGTRLRAFYKSEGKPYQQYAIAGMLASGAEDFKDIILPLLTSDDHQTQLRSYRLFKGFYVSSLGANWKQLVNSWNEDQRSVFIGEIATDYFMSGIAEEFAAKDTSFKVRSAALRALEWNNASESLERVLSSFADIVFEEILYKRVLHEIPPALWSRARTTYNKQLQSTVDPKERLKIRFEMAKIGDKDIDGIKDDLNKWPSERIKDSEEILIKKAVELLHKSNPVWISQWLAHRIVDGNLWRDEWKDFISNISEEYKQDLIKKIETENLQQNTSAINTVLTAVADEKLAASIFSKLCSLKPLASTSFSEASEKHWQITRQLQDLFRLLPIHIAAAGMLSVLSSEFNPIEYELAVELFFRIYTDDLSIEKQMPVELYQRLLRYFKQGISFTLKQDDFNGNLKAELAMVLASLNDPEILNNLKNFIWADIERQKTGRQLRAQGDRGPQGNGAIMSQHNSYIRVIEKLDFQSIESLLLSLFDEASYEADVSKALIRLARITNLKEKSLSQKKKYQALWEARNGQAEIIFDEKRRSRYAEIVKEKISLIEQERLKSSNSDSFNGRLKTLAYALAVLDDQASAERIIDILALPGEWDSSVRIDTLERLLFNGVSIKADAAFRVLDPVISRITQPNQMHDEQNRFLLKQCLCLIPFFVPQAASLMRIKEIITMVNIQIYDLREIFIALGNSRCNEALDLLLEVSTRYGPNLRHISSEWINALLALDTPKSKNVVMSLIDHEIVSSIKQIHLEYYDYEHIAEYIAELASNEQSIKDRVYALCASSTNPKARSLLAGTISRLGTVEALLAGLNLIRDNLNSPIPQELLHGLENIFLGKEPYKDSHAYTIVPRSSNTIRSVLFKMMLEDDSRKNSAGILLGQIELWRLEYGRPDSELRHPSIESGLPWPILISKGAISNAP